MVAAKLSDVVQVSVTSAYRNVDVISALPQLQRPRHRRHGSATQSQYRLSGGSISFSLIRHDAAARRRGSRSRRLSFSRVRNRLNRQDQAATGSLFIVLKKKKKKEKETKAPTHVLAVTTKTKPKGLLTLLAAPTMTVPLGVPVPVKRGTF